MSILTKYLDKLGVGSPKDLSADEKQQFDSWNKVLSEGPITVEKIVDFCKAQKGFAETKLSDLDNSTQKNERLIILNNVYGKIIGLVERPQVEKESLEKYLNSLILDIPK